MQKILKVFNLKSPLVRRFQVWYRLVHVCASQCHFLTAAIPIPTFLKSDDMVTWTLTWSFSFFSNDSKEPHQVDQIKHFCSPSLNSFQPKHPFCDRFQLWIKSKVLLIIFALLVFQVFSWQWDQSHFNTSVFTINYETRFLLKQVIAGENVAKAIFIWMHVPSCLLSGWLLQGGSPRWQVQTICELLPVEIKISMHSRLK